MVCYKSCTLCVIFGEYEEYLVWVGVLETSSLTLGVLPTKMSTKDRQKPRTAFPLNSKRLKLCQLQKLAIALELPPRATGKDLRTIVEAKKNGQKSL